MRGTVLGEPPDCQGFATGLGNVVDRRERIVRLNNLCSFIPDEERAFEFGSTVWRARVPLVKVFFFSRLLPESILKGEEEYLVIGGDYRVRTVL